MKQKRLIALLLAGSMIATTALTGCGGSKREGSDGKAATEESAGEETAGKDPVTLWMHNGPAFVDATKEMAEDFKKETGITVEVQTFPYDVMSQKMKTAYAAGNEPDIIQAFGSWLPTYVNQGAFAAVPDDFAAKFDEEFYEGAVEGLKKNGKYYGVPIEMQCEYGLFYVPEKVKEAYVEDGKPDTFKEVVQVGKSTAKFNGDILEYGGLEFDNGDNVAQMFLSWILQSGGTFWDEEGTHLSLQSEEAKKAWQRMVDLVTVDKVTDTKHASGDVTTDNFFFNKKGAQLVKGAWASCYGDEFKNDNWEYTFFPAFEGDTPKFVVETYWAYVVSEKSKNKDNAFKFVEYCLQPQMQKHLLKQLLQSRQLGV